MAVKMRVTVQVTFMNNDDITLGMSEMCQVAVCTEKHRPDIVLQLYWENW